jgi:hypothetical protein
VEDIPPNTATVQPDSVAMTRIDFLFAVAILCVIKVPDFEGLAADVEDAYEGLAGN